MRHFTREGYLRLLPSEESERMFGEADSEVWGTRLGRATSPRLGSQDRGTVATRLGCTIVSSARADDRVLFRLLLGSKRRRC